MKMKAAILYDSAHPLAVQDVNLSPPQRGEVLVRLVASGICHSDVNIVRGEAKAALPELRKALQSTDPELRLAAAEAVLSIERKPRLKDL